MNEDPQSFVTEINGWISTAAKRQNGLLKLALFLNSCQSREQCDLLENNFIFWIKTVLQIIENHPVSIHAKLAQYCFFLLIQSSKNLSADISRTISTHLIEKSISLLVMSNEQLAKNSLCCLNELMSSYRGACSQYRLKIETYVLTKLDNNSDDVVEWATKCYSKLPYLHKNQGNNDMWYSYFKNALKNANMILNDLFEDFQPAMNIEAENSENVSLNSSNQNEIDKPNTSNSLFLNKSEALFGKINKDNLEFYMSKSVKRFRACCLALGYLFEPLNEQVIVKPKFNEIINFLRRIYFFEIKKLIASSRINAEAKCLNEVISDLFNYSLMFTAKFISIANTNLIPNSCLINQMLSSFGANLSEKTLFGSVALYYDCLTDWIQTVGGNSGFYNYSSVLIEVLLSNITPHATNILAIDTNKNPKAKGAQTVSNSLEKDLFYNNKSILNNHQLAIQCKTFISALKCLRVFVKNFNNKLNYNNFEKIQQTIIGITLSIQHNFNKQKPYDQSKCRIELYRNLYELCLTINVKLAPPLSVSICLFRNALDDCSNDIKSFAQDCLNNLRSFTCPILPIMIKEYKVDFPLENQHMEMDQEQPFKSLVHLTTANNMSTTVQPKAPGFTFSSSNQFNNKKTLNMDIHARINNTSSENSSSNGTNEHNNGNSNSFISNNNSSQLTSETSSKMASNSASLLDIKNSLNMMPSNSNSLKRKNTNREFTNGDDSFQNSNGAKVFLSEKKSLASNQSRSVSYKSYILNNLNLSKNLKVSHEDSNGNENDEDEDEIDDEELDEENEEENEDVLDDDEDDDDLSNDEQQEEISNISGVKKMESTEEIIAIDSDNEEDTNPDDNEFDDDDDDDIDEEEEEEFISDEASVDKPEVKDLKLNPNLILEQTYKTESENSDKKETKEPVNNSNDANDKIMVSKLLNGVDYEDEDEENQEGSNSVSRFSAPSLNNEDNKITIENKENLAVDDSSLVRISPKDLENQKEAMSHSFNILKSPITRGELNEKYTNDAQLNEENLEQTEENNRNAIEEAMLHSEMTNQDGIKFVNLETVNDLNGLTAEAVLDSTKPEQVDDLKIKEMCNTFNPEAVIATVDIQQEEHK